MLLQRYIPCPGMPCQDICEGAHLRTGRLVAEEPGDFPGAFLHAHAATTHYGHYDRLIDLRRWQHVGGVVSGRASVTHLGAVHPIRDIQKGLVSGSVYRMALCFTATYAASITARFIREPTRL